MRWQKEENRMFYIFFQFDNEKFWIEMDKDCYAVRQIVCDEKTIYHISCIEDCLAEGKIDLKQLEAEIVYLTKEEFDTVWNEIISSYAKAWEIVKSKYLIGTVVLGQCVYFYPQGPVIKGKDFIAIYKGKRNILFHESVYVRVTAYDEINMWLVTE